MAGIPQVITEDRASGAQFIDGSLRFDGSKVQYLTRTPTAVGNRNKWTWSGWCKHGGNISASSGTALFAAYSSGADRDVIRYGGTAVDSLDAQFRDGTNRGIYTTSKFRDTGWYHNVVTYDSTVGVKIYVNGVEQPKSNASGGNASHSTQINNTVSQYIGARNSSGSVEYPWDGEMSQVYFLDGQALGPEEFGYTDPLTNTWRPKKYTGRFTKSTPNNGTNWTQSLSATSGSLSNGANAFDGNLSTRAQTANAAPGKELTFAPPAINFTTSLEVYCDQGSAVPTATWNGNTVNPGGGAWVTVYSGSGELSSTYPLVINTETAAQYATLKGVRIDGEILIDNLNDSGANSFYLPMDGNTPIGEDQSGIIFPNDGTVWSNFSSDPNGVKNSGNADQLFNGNLSSGGIVLNQRSTSNTAYYVALNGVSISCNNSVACWMANGASTATMRINGDDNLKVAATSTTNAWVTLNFTGTITKIELGYLDGSGSSNTYYGIQVDGHTLIDGQKGNDWTPMNFGGSVDLPKATGAIPILNTNGGGTVAKPGARTDSKTYTVTASGGNYYLDGALKPTLNAYRGGSYTFDYTGATSHPFYLSSLPDGKHNSKAYSVEFDGTGDYLGVTGGNNYDFGTGDFTIEGYFYTTNNNGTIASSQNYYTANNNGNWLIRISSATQVAFASYDGTGNSEYTEFTVQYQTNTWHHFAFVRSGTTLTCYLDGTSAGTMTVSKSLSDGVNGILIGEDSADLNPEFNGKISNFRINKGTALYTSNFTPPSTALTDVTGTSLLCCQDSNATDVPVGTSIAVNGNASASNTSPFLYDINGYYGVNTGTSNTTKITIPHWAADTLYYYCNAHSGMGSSINVTTDIRKADPYAWKCVLALPLLGSKDDVSASINVNSTTKTTAITGNAEPRSDRWDLYSGAFYFDSTADYVQITPTAGTTLADNAGPYTIEFFFSMNNGRMTDNTYNLMWSTSSGLSIAKWRSGISNKVYFESDGNATGWNVQTQENINSIRWYHFAAVRDGNTITTYLDGVLQGTATATYTASAETWWRVGGQNANGSCHAGYMQDFRIYKGVAKYTENFARVSTNPDILPDTPSGITGKTNLTKITEGAVAFDGNGDYLTVSGPGTLAASSNWCMECFFYCTGNSSGTYRIMSANESAQSTEYILFRIRLGQYQWSTDVANSQPINTATFNKWTHMAFTKEGTTVRGFIDGKKIWETTDNNTVTITNLITGWGYGGEYFPGFISNARFVNGSSVYTADFTPSTAPLTNITNTYLLCCQSTTFAGTAAVSPNLGGVNNGTVWSEYLTDTNGAFQASYPVTKAFNGIVTAAETARASTTNTTSTWTPPGGISYTTSVEVWTYYNGTVSMNGGSATNVVNVQDWTTIASGSGTLNYLTFVSSASNVYIGGVRIDGNILVDPVTTNGNAAATNFNPFTDDINAIRGQETGYATLNPLRNGQTLSNGNLDVVGTNSWQRSVSTINMSSGKWYWEYLITASNEHIVGVGPLDMQLSGNLGAGSPPGSGFGSELGQVNGTGANGSWTNIGQLSTGDLIGVAFDADNGNMYIYANGVAANGGIPSHTGLTDGPYEAVFSLNGSSRSGSVNFGQKPFKFPPPDGFQPLNLSNVQPEKVIARPDQYVGTTLYTGSGETVSPRTIELPHAADLVWAKSRDRGSSHQIADTVRGNNSVLNSNTNSTARNPTTAYNGGGVSIIDGKTISLVKGSTNQANNENLNATGQKGVVWSWKAGGSSNTFNIDDVGYANASDINMNVGALNSSFYDTSDTWSDDLSSPQGAYNNSPFTNAFNGDLSNGFESGNPSGGYSTMRFEPSSGIAVSSVRIYASDYSDGQVTYQWRVNDGSWNNISYTSGNTYKRWIDFNFSGTLNSFEYRSSTSITYKPDLRAVELSGKILVDSGTDLSGLTQYPSITPTGASVGTKQGFSIIKYDGTGSNATVPHGLNQKPNFIIIKRTSNTASWQVYSSEIGATKYLRLNTTAAEAASSIYYNDTEPTSSVFTVGTSAGVNGDGDSYISYIWHDVPGLQKFGSYTGNGNANGPFIELGFRPAIVWVKRSDGGTESWAIYDSSRGPINPNPKGLYANDSATENDASGRYKDFLSNGFKVRGTSGEQNADGATYIYCAWAEAPSINLYGAQANAR